MQLMFVLQEHSAGSHKRLVWGWFFLERPRTKMIFTKALSAIAFCPILFSDFIQDQQWPRPAYSLPSKKKVAEKGIHIQRLTEREGIERTEGWSASD